MANLRAQQLDELKQLLSEHHSNHAPQYGSMDSCREPACIEAKLGLRYLGSKVAPSQDSGPSTFNLK
jgi:hypothetical protein